MRLAILLLCGALVAGCLSTPGRAPQDDGLAFAAALHEGMPPIDWDPDAAIAWWADIATNYPKHDAYTPDNAALRQRLVSDLQAAGLDVEVRSYVGTYSLPRSPVTPPVSPPPTPPQELPDTPYTRLYAIVATKAGTTMPDHRIGLVSHYDTQTFTVNGAYDDASGVAADFHICKALAKVPMDRTLACIFFDGEEQGLVASQKYVEDVVLAKDEGYTYDFVLGYDMTGINWPGHPWKLYAMAGMLWGTPGDPDSADVSALFPFTDDLLHGVLRYPDEGVEVLADSHRNSDERRFKEAGVPILRFAGGLNASDYDQYHQPMDTVQHVYDFAGGADRFEAGFSAIVEVSYATALALDRTTYDGIAAEYGFAPLGPSAGA